MWVCVRAEHRYHAVVLRETRMELIAPTWATPGSTTDTQPSYAAALEQQIPPLMQENATWAANMARQH